MTWPNQQIRHIVSGILCMTPTKEKDGGGAHLRTANNKFSSSEVYIHKQHMHWLECLSPSRSATADGASGDNPTLYVKTGMNSSSRCVSNPGRASKSRLHVKNFPPPEDFASLLFHTYNCSRPHKEPSSAALRSTISSPCPPEFSQVRMSEVPVVAGPHPAAGAKQGPSQLDSKTPYSGPASTTTTGQSTCLARGISFDMVYSGPLPPMDVAEALKSHTHLTMDTPLRIRKSEPASAVHIHPAPSIPHHSSPLGPAPHIHLQSHSRHTFSYEQATVSSAVRANAIRAAHSPARSTCNSPLGPSEVHVSKTRRRSVEIGVDLQQQASELSPRARAMSYWSSAVAGRTPGSPGLSPRASMESPSSETAVRLGPFARSSGSLSHGTASPHKLHSAHCPTGTWSKSAAPVTPGSASASASASRRASAFKPTSGIPSGGAHMQMQLAARLDMLEKAVQQMSQTHLLAAAASKPAEATTTMPASTIDTECSISTMGKPDAATAGHHEADAAMLIQLTSMLQNMQQELADLRAMRTQSHGGTQPVSSQVSEVFGAGEEEENTTLDLSDATMNRMTNALGKAVNTLNKQATQDAPAPNHMCSLPNGAALEGERQPFQQVKGPPELGSQQIAAVAAAADSFSLPGPFHLQAADESAEDEQDAKEIENKQVHTGAATVLPSKNKTSASAKAGAVQEMIRALETGLQRAKEQAQVPSIRSALSEASRVRPSLAMLGLDGCSTPGTEPTTPAPELDTQLSFDVDEQDSISSHLYESTSNTSPAAAASEAIPGNVMMLPAKEAQYTDTAPETTHTAMNLITTRVKWVEDTCTQDWDHRGSATTADVDTDTASVVTQQVHETEVYSNVVRKINDNSSSSPAGISEGGVDATAELRDEVRQTAEEDITKSTEGPVAVVNDAEAAMAMINVPQMTAVDMQDDAVQTEVPAVPEVEVAPVMIKVPTYTLQPPSDLTPRLQPLSVPVPTTLASKMAAPGALAHPLLSSNRHDLNNLSKMQPLETEWDPLMNLWSQRWGWASGTAAPRH